MNEERFKEIETKIAFQEKAIKDLNDVLYEQQQEMEKLRFICDTLLKQLKQVSEFIPGSTAPADEQPPHY